MLEGKERIYASRNGSAQNVTLGEKEKLVRNVCRRWLSTGIDE